MDASTQPGQSYPLGATVLPGGVNFCLFSRNCAALELVLLDAADDPRPARTICLDPHQNRTFYYWHVLVPGIGPGQLYGYRAHGPDAPAEGHRFDGAKVLLDPYARAAVAWNYDREAASRPGDNCAQAVKGVVVDPHAYNWEGDHPLGLPFAHTVIYELHVGGFTRHPSSGVAPALRGTYRGLVEKVPYLQSLGITAVELMPVQQFDPQDAPAGLTNYWGYSPVAFFAPHAGYCASRDPLAPVDDFRDLVKALHRAGIEVILDVVFNHTAEQDASGPTLSFRGLENRAYYILQSDRSRYADYTGCGNTVNTNHSVVRRMVLDCLRHWVVEMHVDGFRFDLASVMDRDEQGRPLEDPPILWEIESDPVLAGTKVIAEAWDAAGLYQVGSFVGHRWAEWNGQFRDDVRRFVKGDRETVARLAQRLCGSPDLYRQPGREPNRSINLVTCHDGFTLNDLVSYNEKHNQANGQDNRDGSDQNLSWNCGVEGPTDDPAVEALRQQQIKNLLTLLVLAQGTPMLLMGDEVRRTQGGNNNAYCQDNHVSWFNWGALASQAGLLRFLRGLLRFTQERAVFRQERFWTEPGPDGLPAIIWHGVRLGQPDWGPDSHSLALTLRCPESGDHLHALLNSYWEPLSFELPPQPAGQHWRRLVDTARSAPDDFVDPAQASPVEGSTYRAAARSVVLLWAGPGFVV